MEYKNYYITNDKVVEKGSSQENTTGIKLDRIEEIKKVRLPKRKAITLVVLTAVILGTISVLPEGVGAFAPPITEIVLVGAFLFLAATVASLFVTERYAIKGYDDEIQISVKGDQGKEFMRQLHRKSTYTADSDVGYGDETDPFVGSPQQKKMNIAMVFLIVAGSTLAIGVVAPMYSDNIGWDDMVPLVEVVQDDNGSGDALLAGAHEEVYEPQETSNGETFESEYATVEVSQGEEDLDEATDDPETYVTMDITIHDQRLMNVDVETPKSQIDGLEEDVRPIPVQIDEEEWARYDAHGEFEMADIDSDRDYERNRNPESPYTARITPMLMDDNPPHIGAEQTVFVNQGPMITDRVYVEEITDKFLKGIDPDIDDVDPEDFDPAEFEEPEPNVIGFEEGDNIRVTGRIARMEAEGDTSEVVLANYTIN